MELGEAKMMDTRLQDAIAEAICKDFSCAKQFALLKAGQRGGKTIVAEKVISGGKFKHVALITSSSAQAKANLEGLMELVGHDTDIEFYAGEPPLSWSQLPNSIIILDEAMWIKKSYDLFIRLLKTYTWSRVLVISSRGPSYDEDIRWQAMSGYSATAWDLNTNVDLGTLLANCQTQDFQNFIRDYCAY